MTAIASRAAPTITPQQRDELRVFVDNLDGGLCDVIAALAELSRRGREAGISGWPETGVGDALLAVRDLADGLDLMGKTLVERLRAAIDGGR